MGSRYARPDNVMAVLPGEGEIRVNMIESSDGLSQFRIANPINLELEFESGVLVKRKNGRIRFVSEDLGGDKYRARSLWMEKLHPIANLALKKMGKPTRNYFISTLFDCSKLVTELEFVERRTRKFSGKIKCVLTKGMFINRSELIFVFRVNGLIITKYLV